MRKNFFPRTKEFWLYHLVGVSVSLAIFILTFSTRSNYLLIDIFIVFLWVPAFTIAVLSFRYLFQYREWESLGLERFIFDVSAISFVLALVVTLVLASFVLPFFGGELYSDEVLQKKNLSLIQSLTKHISTNILAEFFLVSSWLYIYISISNSRRSQHAKMAYLELENSLREAKLKNLSNQLNPHFLFNSLNNIRFMIYENQERADYMITVLSDILRHSIESSANEMAQEKLTLREELSVAERYLDLVKLQFEDRLKIEISVDEDLLSCLLPPMMIQLLVENAIKHGVEYIREQSTLTISIFEYDCKMNIEITNPLAKNHINSEPSTKAGLSNIEQRLALLYQGEAIFQTAQIERNFVATLIFPKEYK